MEAKRFLTLSTSSVDNPVHAGAPALRNGGAPRAQRGLVKKWSNSINP
jgi:hypothetical protein